MRGRWPSGPYFPVFQVDTLVSRQSGSLTGIVDRLPESDAAVETLSDACRTVIFDEADLSRGVRSYAFDIEGAVGVKYLGLLLHFDED